jgi:hypothetical protein
VVFLTKVGVCETWYGISPTFLALISSYVKMAFLELIPGNTSTQQIVYISLLGLILSFITRRVYSVYFGPLSKFPGPKLAAATLWYEFYYDVICQGNYTFKIKELHKKYGIDQPLPFI